VKKQATLFDHLNNISYSKKDWNTLSEMDKKSFSVYMVNRFLSMNMDYIDIVNEIQQYTNGQLKNKEIYNIYKNILPKKKGFFGYIKGSKKAKYSPDLLERLKIYFEVSYRELEDYLSILSKDDIIAILQKFGHSDKEIKKMI
jgi:hypothetical protein